MHAAKAVRCLARLGLMLQVQAGIHIAYNDSRPSKRANHLVPLLGNYLSEPDQQTNSVAASLSPTLSELLEFGKSIRSPKSPRSMEVMNNSLVIVLLMKALEWLVYKHRTGMPADLGHRPAKLIGFSRPSK